MNTTVGILQAASEIVGGIDALAERLRVGLHALTMFMEGRRHLPDSLLLRAVDIILEDRESKMALAGQAAAGGRRLPIT